MGSSEYEKSERLSLSLLLCFLLPQVGSYDLTLVNLHLAALILPGSENPSRNHSDSHRLASFVQTLQETLKGRKRALSVARPAAPTAEGRPRVASSEHRSHPFG